MIDTDHTVSKDSMIRSCGLIDARTAETQPSRRKVRLTAQLRKIKIVVKLNLLA